MFGIYLLGVAISFLICIICILSNLKNGYDCTLKDLVLLIISSAASFITVIILVINELQEDDGMLDRITIFKGFNNK